MDDEINCWNCGADLSQLPQPFSRKEECPGCSKEVRVCKMCIFYDPKLHNSCKEPVADRVNDKERANFCDYFKVKSGAYCEGGNNSDAMKGLSDLFGGVAVSSSPSSGDAKKKLEDLFK
ncbi:MAG: hypothetical protein D6B27_11630 [Gammaproteobacteria bacterium]|nr:MAG: hypothetical protein D6B27_11630 [Gammaproteobacteria bacterium]